MHRENFRILIVDDEKSFLLLLVKILEDEGYTVKGMTEPEEALKAVESFLPNLIITDLKMPKMDGIKLMNEARKKNEEIDFLMITAFATVETAVEAMKKGASDYITKPLKDPEQLRIIVSKIYERQRLLAENRLLKAEALYDMPPIDIIFLGMQNILNDIKHVAPTDATVILYGETGTGKSLIAKTIHYMSGRSGPFVDINCAAIPENLLESELFGYEKGAFTGALTQKKGRLELANDGTIFLDEVSEISLTLQSKFLRVLQDKVFERLGSLNTIKTNARIIAATNKDLKTEIKEKKFREDLYYRLNVFPINIPPLRERRDYILDIAEHLLKVISARLGKEIKTIPEEAKKRLIHYKWPGNVRELENVIERSIIISKGDKLTLPELEPMSDTIIEQRLNGDIKSIERIAIENALMKTSGNRKKAAEMLGISLRTLQYKIKAYEIS